MGLVLPFVVIILIIAVAMLAISHREAAQRARIAKRIGFGVSAFIAVIVGLLLVGGALRPRWCLMIRTGCC